MSPGEVQRARHLEGSEIKTPDTSMILAEAEKKVLFWARGISKEQTLALYMLNLTQTFSPVALQIDFAPLPRYVLRLGATTSYSLSHHHS